MLDDFFYCFEFIYKSFNMAKSGLFIGYSVISAVFLLCATFYLQVYDSRFGIHFFTLHSNQKKFDHLNTFTHKFIFQAAIPSEF